MGGGIWWFWVACNFRFSEKSGKSWWFWVACESGINDLRTPPYRRIGGFGWHLGENRASVGGFGWHLGGVLVVTGGVLNEKNAHKSLIFQMKKC
jgi:hypothetical protein